VLRSYAVAPVAVALLSVAGCGGSLAPPDGGGGTGGTGSGGTTGTGGGIALDASSDIARCLAAMPATPIAGTPCQYVIPMPCDFEDRSHIGVEIDGVEIPRDTTDTNGWDYTDPTFTRIDIHGPTCDALTSGAATTVTIVFRIILP
jgi:hypothetical protein